MYIECNYKLNPREVHTLDEVQNLFWSSLLCCSWALRRLPARARGLNHAAFSIVFLSSLMSQLSFSFAKRTLSEQRNVTYCTHIERVWCVGRTASERFIGRGREEMISAELALCYASSPSDIAWREREIGVNCIRGNYLNKYAS